MDEPAQTESMRGYAVCGDARSGSDPAQVPLRIQRDAVSELWRERFLGERGDRSYLDGGRLFSRFRRGGAFARLFLGPR